MPLNPIQFPILQQEPSFFERFQGIQQGEQNLHKTQAENFIKELEGRNYQDEMNSKLALQHAQALNQYNQALGIGGHKGKGANEYAPHDYEKLENYHDKQVAKYGIESEQAKRSKQAIEAYLSSHGESRFAPSMIGKLQNERDALAAKLGTDHPDVKAYDSRILKEQSDVGTRERSLLALNLEKSMDALNSDDLTRYSGPAGQSKLAVEKAKDMITGEPSPEYQRYLDALVASEYETSELRQFFKESKDKEVRKHLAILSNPTAWGKSPAAAKSQLEKSRSIVRKQLETFRGGLKGTESHLGTKEKEPELGIATSETVGTFPLDDPLGLF